LQLLFDVSEPSEFRFRMEKRRVHQQVRNGGASAETQPVQLRFTFRKFSYFQLVHVAVPSNHSQDRLVREAVAKQQADEQIVTKSTWLRNRLS
jgi:hypothetical protein